MISREERPAEQKGGCAGHCHPHQRHQHNANVLDAFRAEAQDKLSWVSYNGFDVAYTLNETKCVSELKFKNPFRESGGGGTHL